MHNKRNFIKFFSFRNRVGKRSEKKSAFFRQRVVQILRETVQQSTHSE